VKHVQRILRIGLTLAGGVVALALALAVFVLFTEPGARVVLHIANGRTLPFKARAIHGTLARRVVILGASVKIGPVDATVDTVTVAWRPLELRSRHIDVTDVMIAGATIKITPSGAPGTTKANEKKATPGKPWIFDADHVRVRRTSLDAPGNVRLHDIDVTATGSHEGYRAVARCSGSAWRFDNMRAYLRADGNTNAATADSLAIDVLGGAVHGNAFVRWSPGISWRAHIGGDDIHFGAMLPKPEEWPGTLAFRVRSTGLVNGDTLRIGADIASLDGMLRRRPVSVRGRVDIDGKTIAASNMVVRWGRASATLSGRMADSADVRFDASVPALGELLPRARGSVAAKGELTGTRERMHVMVDVRGTGVRTGTFDVPNANANLRATLDAHNYRPYAVNLERANIDLAGGRLQTSGHASWEKGIEWQGRVEADNFEPSALTPHKWNLRGPVSLRIASSGTKQGKNLRGDVTIESLTGRLRGRPVSGAGHVVVNNHEAEISDLHLEWGRTHLRADGHAGKAVDLSLDVAAPDLSAVVPEWRGSIMLTGKAHGKLPRPAINAELSGDSVRVLGYGARHFEGHIKFDPSFAEAADVRLALFDAVRGKSTLDTLQVTAVGPRDAHRITVTAARGKMGGAITLQGAFADSSWSGVIDDVHFHEPTTGTWETRHPAPLYIAPGHASLDSLVLASKDASLSLRGKWTRGGAASGALALNGLPLSLFQSKLHGSTITGAVSGTGSFTRNPGQGLDAKLDFTAGPGEIALNAQRISYQAHLHGLAAKEGVSAHVDAALSTGSQQVATLGGAVSIPGFVAGIDSLGGHAVKGQVDFECRDIGPVLAVFAPDLTHASGALSVHVTPNGTTDNFRLTGKAALEKARFDTAASLHLRNINLALVSDGQGTVTLDGGVTSGGGRIEVKASSAKSQQGWVSGTFAAKGTRFQVINRPDAQVFVSPDINLNVAERKALITGTVTVPYTRIELSEVPPSAVSPSPDVVIVEDTLAAKPKLEVRTQVRVALGDSVNFTGFGLRARLGGSLAVDDARGRPTQGTGEIQILQGKYRIFGNELTIDQGRLIFGGGPIDNPGVDVRAIRGLTTQNVVASTGEVVGVNIRGTLRKPVLSFFSNPPMSQNEIMSYLLTGHAPSSDQSAAAGLAMLIAMQQGQSVAGDIGKKLSVETHLETGEKQGEASFVAGKYLSPKLYVSYAAGLFEHTNTFRTRYSLTGHWTLQAESGRYDSTDLLYWFERGK
jgi:translocation and assembly module TamB